jgi:hypothetical protein
MRYFIIILLLLAAIPACEIESYLLQENEIEVGNIYDYDFEGSEEIPEFETIEEAAKWIVNNSVFVQDNILFEIEEYWQTPEEFYYNRNENNKMQGDCEDYAIFLGYILNYKMEYRNTELIIVKDHALFYCDQYIETLTGKTIPENSLNIIDRISYSEALWMTINYHDNVRKYK